MINYMYLLRLGMLPIWPEPSHVAERLPAVFKELYPTTFMIIDATELKCEIASSLPAQPQLYGSYTSHTTLKGLISMTPDDAVAFVSELFAGSISDRELTLKKAHSWTYYLQLAMAPLSWLTRVLIFKISWCPMG